MKKRVAQQNSWSQLRWNCPIFAPRSPSPHLLLPLFHLYLQGPGYCHGSRYIKRAQRDNWVTQIRGHWLQSLRATRGVTAATPDWIWNGFLGSRTANSSQPLCPGWYKCKKKKNLTADPRHREKTSTNILEFRIQFSVSHRHAEELCININLDKRCTRLRFKVRSW